MEGLDAILDDLCARHDVLRPEEHTTWDLAVWRAGLLLAVVRGDPESGFDVVRLPGRQ